MSKENFNKLDIKTSLVFMVIACIGGVFSALYSLPTIPVEQRQGLTETQFILIMTLQTGILYGCILGFIGLKLSRATRLKQGILEDDFLTKQTKYKFNKKSLLISMSFGFFLAATIVLGNKFIFNVNMMEATNGMYVFNPLYFFSGIIYGGIVEEIMLRLFLMSLIVFVLYKIFAKKQNKTDIPSWIYVIAIILSALMFSLGHLPVAFAQPTITLSFIASIIILNSIGGIIFGSLYWKKGFEYGVIAHMFSHIFMQLFFFQIFF